MPEDVIVQDPATLPPPAGGGDEALKSMQAEIDRLKTRLDAPPPAPAPAPGAAPSKEDYEKQFFRDPLGMSSAIANAAVQNAMATNNAASFDTLVEMAKSTARNRNPAEAELFDKLLPDIEVKISNVPQHLRGNVNVWSNAFSMVKGEKFMEIREFKNRTPAVHIADGPAAPSNRQPAAPPKEKLSDDEAMVARKLGLSSEDYLRGKKLYETQEWPDVLTFDTTEARRRKRDAAAAAARK